MMCLLCFESSALSAHVLILGLSKHLWLPAARRSCRAGGTESGLLPCRRAASPAAGWRVCHDTGDAPAILSTSLPRVMASMQYTALFASRYAWFSMASQSRCSRTVGTLDQLQQAFRCTSGSAASPAARRPIYRVRCAMCDLPPLAITPAVMPECLWSCTGLVTDLPLQRLRGAAEDQHPISNAQLARDATVHSTACGPR